MAIDTALKRGSALHPYSLWGRVLPFPDGTVDAIDRPALAGTYSGIAISTGGSLGPSIGGSPIHIGSPWRSIYPFPHGALSQGDRQQTAFLYANIAAIPLSTGSSSTGGGADWLMPYMNQMRMTYFRRF